MTDPTPTTTPTPHHVHLSARRWLQRLYGNTYHTVSVLVDGVHVGTSEPTYGYGTHYLHTAGVVMIRAGLTDLPADTPYADASQAAYDVVRDLRGAGVTVTEDVVDVELKRELHRPSMTTGGIRP
jgi:hypothetical protein